MTAARLNMPGGFLYAKKKVSTETCDMSENGDRFRKKTLYGEKGRYLVKRNLAFLFT